MKLKPAEKNDIPNITLPQIVLAAASMLTFVVFLITMYLNFHAAVFFSVWIWCVAATLIYSGTLNRKLKKSSGTVYIIMGAAAIIAGIWIIII